MMREMEELLPYDVSEMDLFCEDEQAVKLPSHQKGWKKSLSIKDGPSVGREMIMKIKT